VRSYGKKVEVKCAQCQFAFMTRVADCNRGWGRFCSKSCKAIWQTQIAERGSKGRFEGWTDETHTVALAKYGEG